MRIRHQSPLLFAALLTFAESFLLRESSGTLLAENVSRSDAQTAGEKRLLDWDLSKSYDLSRSRTNANGKAPSRSFITQTFSPGGFQTKAFSTEAFTSSEFLAPETKKTTKTFFTKPAFPIAASVLDKSYLTGNSRGAPPKVTPTFATRASNSPVTFAEAARPFQGPEAARREQKYTPGNAPIGGVIEGRRLSIDEVREILNKSK